jgi:hypothetical protein
MSGTANLNGSHVWANIVSQNGGYAKNGSGIDIDEYVLESGQRPDP